MTEFKSDIRILPYSQQKVYEVLSNMGNLEKIKDRIPSEKIKDFSFDQNSCSFTANPIGKVKFSIVERIPSQTIKLAVDEAPIDVNMLIQLLEVSAEETQLELRIHADLNPFLKPMLSKPLQDGINKIADVLTAIPYDEISLNS